MKSLLDVLKLSTEHLENNGIANARREAQDILSGVLGIPRLQLYLDFDRPLNDTELTACREQLRRRATGEPLAYIQGEVEFYNCIIKVTPDVLIPRPETEILVDRIAQELAEEPLEGRTLWDLCCGSGCIGIALKMKFPQLNVVLSDLSKEALATAKANAEANDVEIGFLQGDLLAPFTGQKAHYVVCNPPYISEEEFETLDPQVRNFEPKQALLAPDQGLAFYKQLAVELPAHLHPGGKVWFEIGYQQGNALKEIFNTQEWQNVEITPDWAGHDRFFQAEFTIPEK